MAIPRAAVTQIMAAVVIPLTLASASPLKMTPAPTKPMPVTILEAMRSGLPVPPMMMEKIVKIVAPRQIRVSVRKPADLLRYSLSAPRMPPMSAARISLMTISVGNAMFMLFRFWSGKGEKAGLEVLKIGAVVLLYLSRVTRCIVEQSLLPVGVCTKCDQFIRQGGALAAGAAEHRARGKEGHIPDHAGDILIPVADEEEVDLVGGRLHLFDDKRLPLKLRDAQQGGINILHALLDRHNPFPFRRPRRLGIR